MRVTCLFFIVSGNCIIIHSMIANYYMIFIIYVFMNHRETWTAKTIRESFYGLMVMADTNKNDKLQRCLFMMV
jgi:hypothetical protein